ncbi:unnamed protein product, partial [Phaeothamnion confervicola]
ANIDPKAPVPQALIDFLMRRVAGMLLHFLVRAARKIGMQPENPHRHRIQSDTEFYMDWMLPKFEKFYQSRQWPFVPPSYLTLPDSGGRGGGGGDGTAVVVHADARTADAAAGDATLRVRSSQQGGTAGAGGARRKNSFTDKLRGAFRLRRRRV